MSQRWIAACALACLGSLPACGSSDEDGEADSAGDLPATGDGPGDDGDTDGATEAGDDGDDGDGDDGDDGADTTDDGTIFDLGGGNDDDDDGEPDECQAQEMGGVVDCTDQAPPDAFDPTIEWTFTALGDDIRSGVSPLVANLTDDNLDMTIDLCDTPDVVLIAGPGDQVEPDLGHLYVLDGATGSQHFGVPGVDLAGYGSPALGDMDDDGIPEIAAITRTGGLVLFEHDGATKWTWTDGTIGLRSSVAIANIDNAGRPEIIAERYVIDADGNTVFQATDPMNWGYSTTTAADLDGDGDLEIILPRAAYRPDGTELYNVPSLPSDGLVQVGDLDDDGQPEVLVTNANGFTIVEHDGTVQAGNQDLRPTGDPADHVNAWRRPAAIHDFDGDGRAEFSLSSRGHYSVFEVAPIGVLWTAVVSDQSGIAGGTAFDFLGDGHADAMYADEQALYVFDGLGEPLLDVDHSSGTYIEFPVVADIDNDGAAEILVVSNEGGGGATFPTIQAIGHVDNLWIQARRIWNQHTYHVTNVLEDGTIPQFEPPHWTLLNTFRTQAQIEGGGVCQPPAG